MKKYYLLFQDEKDKLVFAIMRRTMRDSGIKTKMPFSYYIGKCLASRNGHPSEGYYGNISYWPSDIKLAGGLFPTLFLARLINCEFFNFKTMKSFEIHLVSDHFFNYALAYTDYIIDKNTINEVYSAVIKLEKKLGSTFLLNSASIFKEKVSPYIEEGIIEENFVPSFQVAL